MQAASWTFQKCKPNWTKALPAGTVRAPCGLVALDSKGMGHALARSCHSRRISTSPDRHATPRMATMRCSCGGGLLMCGCFEVGPLQIVPSAIYHLHKHVQSTSQPQVTSNFASFRIAMYPTHGIKFYAHTAFSELLVNHCWLPGGDCNLPRITQRQEHTCLAAMQAR